MNKILPKSGIFIGISLSLSLFIGLIWFGKNYPMKLRNYTKYALYMAVLDDEIMRKELGEDLELKEKLHLPNKMESLKYRYSLFLELNKGKREEEIKREISAMEERLRSTH